jgi:hypothetical protein
MNSSKMAVLVLGLPALTFAQVCTDIEDDTARLACYDALNKESEPAAIDVEQPDPSEQAPGGSRSAESPGETATVVEADSPDEFGKREADDGPREYVEGTIVEIIKSGDIYYLKLDNGQVWREVTNSTMRFREGRAVTITEGILNSYDLQMEGYNKIVKVKRVR